MSDVLPVERQLKLRSHLVRASATGAYDVTTRRVIQLLESAYYARSVPALGKEVCFLCGGDADHNTRRHFQQ